MVRPIDGNNGGNNGGNNDDDNGNANENNDDDNGNDNDDYRNEYLLKLDRLLKNLKDDKKFLKTFSENIDDKSKEELEAEKLEIKFENLKNRRLVKERIDAPTKKLNDLNKARHNKASSSETSSHSETSSNSENNKDDEYLINLNNMSFDDLLNNPNMTPKIAE